MDAVTVFFGKIRDILGFDSANPLLFNTGLFLFLFLAFIGIYRLLQHYKYIKLIFVILFSLYFYYKSSAEYCFILLGVCVFDYILGLWLGAVRRNWIRRLIVTLNVVANIGMLAWFKYFNLVISTFANISGTSFDPLDIILPAGISFFTFRSISYIVDIYRHQIEPCKDFLAYTFYLTFFPPLLAGPVVRARDMLPQVKLNPVATNAMVAEGIFLIICGLVKKVVVADYIGVNFVDRVFDNPALYSGFENLIAVYGFTIQLYCDFSGYSDMAIGIALLLGYNFFDNFRSPFKSQNPTEFWRRWHISLSFWLRDYLYIPMGGNRCSRAKKNFNLFSTMVIGGLWHGASWMYVIWGALHGIFLIGHKEMKKVFGSHKRTWWRVVGNVFITFNLVALAFMFFRAPSMSHVGQMFTQMFTAFHLSVAPQFIEGYFLIVLLMAGALVMHFAPSKLTGLVKRGFVASHPVILALILAVILLVVIQFRSSEIVPFLYLQY